MRAPDPVATMLTIRKPSRRTIGCTATFLGIAILILIALLPYLVP